MTPHKKKFSLTRRDAVSTVALGGLGMVLSSTPAAAAADAATTENTRAVALRWFNALCSGDGATAIDTLSPDIEWYNYIIIPGYNDDMPWIGTFKGKEAVVKTFEIFGAMVKVNSEKLINLLVEGDQAAGVIHELSTVKTTGMDFEIEFIQWVTVKGDKIVRWKSYTDPSSIIRAIRGK